MKAKARKPSVKKDKDPFAGLRPALKDALYAEFQRRNIDPKQPAPEGSETWFGPGD